MLGLHPSFPLLVVIGCFVVLDSVVSGSGAHVGDGYSMLKSLYSLYLITDSGSTMIYSLYIKLACLNLFF